MKIVQMIFSLSGGGAERMVVNLCNELAREHEVVLITVLEETGENGFYAGQLSENVRKINLKKHKGLSLGTLFTIRRILRKENPDVVHCHLNTVLYTLPSVLFKTRRVIHTLHSVASATIGFRQQKRLNKWLYASERVFPVALSEECATSYRTFYELQQIPVVVNGVPEASISREFDKITQRIDEVCPNSEILRFIHVARCSEAKNQRLMLNVFSALIREGEPIQLLILGQGFEALEKEVNEKGQHGIHFFGAQEHPNDFMVQSDALVLSSLWEGMPMCALEALSCGIPIVSTPAGGMVDVVQPGVNGVLSENFEEDSFRLAVQETIALLKAGGFEEQTIKEGFRSRFSIRNSADAYQKIYERN